MMAGNSPDEEYAAEIARLEARVRELEGALRIARNVIRGPKNWRGMLVADEVKKTALAEITAALTASGGEF